MNPTSAATRAHAHAVCRLRARRCSISQWANLSWYCASGDARSAAVATDESGPGDFPAFAEGRWAGEPGAGEGRAGDDADADGVAGGNGGAGTAPS